MAAEVYLHTTDTEAIDVMASPIIQDTTGPLNYVWLGTSGLPVYGDIGPRMGNILPYQKSVAYKARILDEITHHDDTTQFVGSLDCILDPASAACGGRGPYQINGALYYIDVMFLYVVNEGDANAYAPILSVDTSRCDEYYGMIIGSPKLPAGTKATVGGGLVASAPKYTNFLNSLNQTTVYEWTAVDSTLTNMVAEATPANLVSIVASSITNGQYPITMKDNADNPITITGEVNGGTDYFQPFMIVRYIHESAPTKIIDINISVSYQV